jgi:hypothetical protein
MGGSGGGEGAAAGGGEGLAVAEGRRAGTHLYA